MIKVQLVCVGKFLFLECFVSSKLIVNTTANGV